MKPTLVLDFGRAQAYIAHMDYRRAAVLLVILCALGATSAFAATCQPAPLATVYLQNGFSCSEGQFTVKGFSFSETQGGLDPNLISVIPINTPSQIGFQFLGSFTAGTGQISTYVFRYFIDAPPIIHGEQNDLDPINFVTLNTDLCGGFAFPCLVPPGQDLGTITATTAQPMGKTTLMTDVNALGVQNTLTLNGNGAPATSGGFDNITVLSPEPAAILLMATGLLGMLVLRSRKKLRQVLLQIGS